MASLRPYELVRRRGESNQPYSTIREQQSSGGMKGNAYLFTVYLVHTCRCGPIAAKGSVEVVEFAHGDRVAFPCTQLISSK